MMIANRSSGKGQSRKFNRTKAIAALSAASSVIAWTHFAQADTWGNNGGTALNSAGSWTDETSPSTDMAPPGATDIAQFDSLDALAGTNTYFLNGATSWMGLSIVNPAGGIVIGNAADEVNTLTLGANGISMGSATQSLVINDPLALGQNEAFNVDGTQSLTISNTISMGAATLTFEGAGTQNVNGIMSDGGAGGAITQTGSGTTILTASNSYTGATTVNRGTLELNYAAAGAPGSNIAPSGGTGLRLGGATLFVNGGAGGGSQTFAATSLTSTIGNSIVQVTSNGSLPTLALGTISVDTSLAAAGGTIDFAGPATSTDGLDASPVAATASITVGSTATGTGGILLDGGPGTLPFAVVGQPSNPNDVVDFAAVNGGVVVGGSTVSGFYTALPTSGGESFNNTNNYDVSNAGEIRFSSNSGFTSLRFNTPNGGLFNGAGFGGNNMDQLIVKSGNVLSPACILVTPNVEANNILIQGAGGPSVICVGGENGTGNNFTIFQYDTQNSLIIDGGIHHASGHNNGYTQAGPGVVQLNGESDINSTADLDGGLTILGNLPGVGQGYAFGSGATVYLNGGNLDTDYTGTFDGSVSGRAVSLGPSGGGLSATTGNTLTVDGAITGGGPLNIGYGTLQTNEENASTLALTTTNTNGNGYVLLTGGASNTYTGGTNVNYGVLQLDSASAGTGSITVNSGGTLQGTATLTNNVLVKSGGLFTPGDATSAGPVVSPMTIGSLTVNTGSILEYGMNGSSTSGLIKVSSLSLGSSPDNVAIYFAATKSVFTNSGTFDIIDVTSGGAISGSLSNLSVQDTSAGLNYAFGTVSDGSGGDYVQLTITGGGTVYTWVPNNGGNWNSAPNWNPNSSFPNNYLSTADLLGAYTGGGTATINLNTAIQIGTVNFDDTSGSYLIAAGGGGSLSLGGAATLEDLAGNHTISAPITLSSASVADVVSASNTLTLSGAISGAGGLTAGGVGGAGTVLLTNSGNSYGTTTVQAGTLQVGNGSSNGSLGTGTVMVNTNGTLTFDNPNSYTLSDTLTGSGTLNQNGAGELVLSGTDSVGPVNIAGGSTIQIGGTGSLTAGNLSLTGKLDLNGNNASFGTLTGTGTIDDIAGTTTSTLTTSSGTSSTFSGVIQNTSASGPVALVKAGVGTLTLSGNNSFSGGTTINAGAITPANNNALGTGAVTINDGDGLEFTTSGITISNAITDATSSNEFADVPSGTATIAGAITMAGGDSYREGTSGGTIQFSGNTTLDTTNSIFTRGNVVFMGTGIFDNTANNVTIGRSSNSASLNFTVQDSAVVTGTAAAGSSGIQIGGLNGSSDDLNVTVTLAGSGQLVAATGSNMDIDNSDTTNASITIDLNGTSSMVAGAFTETGSSSTATVALNLNGGSIVANASSASFFPNFANVTAVDNNGVTFNNGGFNITVGLDIQGSFGDLGFTATGAGGTTTLTGTNTWQGPTTVSGGTLVIGAAGALPHNATVDIGSSSTLQLATQTGGETLTSLSIANTSGGTLDITNDHVIINYTSNDPKTTILSYLATGADGGTWTGAGIVSSTAANLAGQNYGVSFSDGADGINPALTSGEIEVAYSQYGDITQQGLVNAADFHILASNFGQTTTKGWEAGDFLYQGVVNAEDFHLLAENFGQTASGEDVSISSADWAALDAFATANGLSVPAVVPEPASLGLLAIAGAGLLARRKRRRA